MSYLNPRDWPYWAHAARMAVTIALMIGFGAHAWAQVRSRARQPAALRWVVGLYALAFFFAAWANFVMVLVTLLAHEYQQGPYRVGTFSLLLLATYVLTLGVRPSSHSA